MTARCCNAAVCDSLDALRPYVPWAGTVPTLADSEAVCRKAHARFRLREDLMMLIFERVGRDAEGDLLGGTGLHRMDWNARRFEIGYWRRTGHEGRGIATEAVHDADAPVLRRTACASASSCASTT